MPTLTVADQRWFCKCYKVEGNFMTDKEKKKIKKERQERIRRWEKLKEKYNLYI